MKKLLLLTCMLALLVANALSQINPKDIKKDTLIRQGPIIRVPVFDCKCENNILQDGDFATCRPNPGTSDISSISPIWKPQMSSPQWVDSGGCCNAGYVAMWGNKAVGESVRQNNVPFIQGRTYKITYCARFRNQTGPQNPLAIFRFTVSSGRIDPSSPITNTSWDTYSFNWTANVSTSWLDIGVENNNTVNNGALVSWGHIDAVCIQDITCDCGEWKPVIFGGPSTKTAVGCGQTIVVKQGQLWTINPSYLCKGKCDAKITGTLTSPSGQVANISFPYSFAPKELCTYRLSLQAVCGDKKCPPCNINIFSTPGCPGDITGNIFPPKD